MIQVDLRSYLLYTNKVITIKLVGKFFLCSILFQITIHKRKEKSKEQFQVLLLCNYTLIQTCCLGTMYIRDVQPLRQGARLICCNQWMNVIDWISPKNSKTLRPLHSSFNLTTSIAWNIEVNWEREKNKIGHLALRSRGTKERQSNEMLV